MFNLCGVVFMLVIDGCVCYELVVLLMMLVDCYFDVGFVFVLDMFVCEVF